MKTVGISHTPKPYQMQHTIPTKDVAEMLAMQEVNISENTEKLVDFFVPRFLNEGLELDLNATEQQTFDLILEKVKSYIELEQEDYALKNTDERLKIKKQELGLDQNTHDGFIYAIGMKNYLKIQITGALMASEEIANNLGDITEKEKLYKELKEKTFNWLRLMNPDALPNISDKDFLDVLLAGSIASSVWQVHGAIS